MKKKLLNVYLKNKKIIDKIAFEKLNSIKEKTFDSSCSIQCYTLKLLEQIFQAFHKKVEESRIPLFIEIFYFQQSVNEMKYKENLHISIARSITIDRTII